MLSEYQKITIKIEIIKCVDLHDVTRVLDS